MKFFLLIVSILLIPTAALTQGTEEPWDLSWPFFKSTSGPSGAFNGYGDWCVIEEGPHPGLDFAALTDDSVVVPTDQVMVSLGAKDFGAASGGCVMAIAPSVQGNPPYWGWGLLHLNIEHPEDWPFYHNSPLTGRQLLAPCFQYEWSPGNPAPLHLHLAWTECDIDPDFPYVDIVPIGPFYGYYNPFEYFEDDLSTYDEIQFKKVHFEGFYNTGAWFMPDGTETSEQISALTDYQVFQDFVSGAIDIAVSPFSAFQGLSDRDSAGVYSISYEILRQDPFTLYYLPAAPDTGNFDDRFLMQMRNEELPYGDSDEFRAIFLDGHLTDGTNPPVIMCNPGENAYIVTNSGAKDTLNWQTGWDNVWTAASVNDWATGICKGAWDTFLAEPDITGKPSSNREAFFPDGRYVVEVTAVSHGFRTDGRMTLPVDDLGSSNPEIAGIIVDNFLPSIGAVIIYSSNFAGDSDSVDVKYMATWEDTGKDDSGNSVSWEYLEELREDLRFFQALERSEAAEIPSLPRNIPAIAEYSQRLPEQPAEGSAYAFVFDRYRGIPVDAGVNSDLDICGTDYCCCLPEGAVQDPVELLLEEIARVEGEMDYDGNTRILCKSVNGYIPIGGLSKDSETLNMLVIYSEPTMVENSSGSELTDVIWMTGHIADMEYWDSREDGKFVRDTPSGNAEHVNILQDVLEEFFPEEPDACYAVHYTFEGNLPSEYSGKLQVHIGRMYPANNQGPRDLAEHLMDGYPRTVPATRKGYESWSWIRDENDRSFYPEGYEPGSDLSHHWGRPWWDRHWNTVKGHVGMDIVAEVNLYKIMLHEARFLDSCYYWCGFWMYISKPGQFGFDVPIVKPDGSVFHHRFGTMFPVIDYHGAGLEEPFWMGGPSSPSPAISSDSRYFWTTGSSCDVLENLSFAWAYCVDSETREKRRVCLCNGWCTGTSQSDDMQFDCCTAYIDRIYNSGAALVCYFVCIGPDQYEEYFIILSPPYGGPMNTIEETSSSRQSSINTIIDEGFLRVLSNPACETLDVMVSGESGETWKLDLYDISGRCVVSETGVLCEYGSVLNIGVESLPSGVYMLRAEFGGIEEVRSISIVH